MKYCLVPAPPAFIHHMFFFFKANKDAILHYLLEDITPAEDLQGRPFHPGTHYAAPYSYQFPPDLWICIQVLDQVVAKKHYSFSTNSYHSQSIKTQQWLRRRSSENIILAGPATRKPFDFKKFRTNEGKKKQLCHLLLRVRSGQQAASRLG